MREPERAGWRYYAAIVLFLAVLAFAVLGLVRSSSFGRPSGSARRAAEAPSFRAPGGEKAPVRIVLGPAATPQIPPPTRSAPTEPPSRTYLHPPEAPITAVPQPGAQPRL
jgi:hypothetical protein